MALCVMTLRTFPHFVGPNVISNGPTNRLLTRENCLFRYMRDLYSSLERLGIPGPRPVWVFGNTLEFKDKVRHHYVTNDDIYSLANIVVLWLECKLCL